MKCHMRTRMFIGWVFSMAAAMLVAQDSQQQLRMQLRQEQFQRYLDNHKDPQGRVRPDLLLKGAEYVKHMKIAAGIRPIRAGASLATKNALAGPQAASLATTDPLTGVQWTQIGPAPMSVDSNQSVNGSGPDSGEIVDIAIDPRNTTDQVIYVATNDGGVWKSSDGGTTWTATMDFMPSLSIGAVAVDPNNPSIVYAGTGDPFDGLGRYCCNGSPNLKAIGIYKSIDAGATWTHINPLTFVQSDGTTFTGIGMNRILVWPSNSNVVLLATQNGLYRSADGGQNFGTAPTFNDGQPIFGGAKSFISDLKLDPNGNVVAAVSGQGIFVSTDGGVTFPTNLFANPGAPAAPFGSISFSANGTTIYSSVVTSAGADSLFRSTDSGAHWTQVPAAGLGGCSVGCGYSYYVAVDPQDSTRVYIGLTDLWLSTDSGGTFNNLGDTTIHDDFHALVFSPPSHFGGSGAPTRLYESGDGGIARVDYVNVPSIGLVPSFTNLNAGIATNLFITMDMGRNSSTNNGYIYGGLQDQGVPDHRPTMAQGEWHLNTGGDGFAVAVDPANGANAYGRYNNTTIFTSSGGMDVNCSPPGCGWTVQTLTGLGAGGVQTLVTDPNNGATVYTIQGNQLCRGSHTGNTINFTCFPAGGFSANLSALGSNTGVATAQIDSNTLWVGLGNGKVARITNALASTPTVTEFTIPGAPNFAAGPLPVNGIAMDPTNTSVVVVVYPGFSDLPPSDSTKHVFMTTDNGADWTDITGVHNGTQNLPDLPLNSVVIDPGTSPHTIIVASDVSVMRTTDQGQTWQVYGVGFPTVLATTLALDTTASPSLLRVSTYGRSVFELTAATGPLLAINANLAFGQVCPGDSPELIMQLFNVGSQNLVISSIQLVPGSSTDFQIVGGPAFPVTILPGEEIDYTIQFTPTGPPGTNETAIFQINSNDQFQPSKQVFASGTVGGPTIKVTGSTAFGNACAGSNAQQTVQVCDFPSSGSCALHVSSATLDAGCHDFTLVNDPFPATVSENSCLNLTVQFSPTSVGSKSCNLTIVSDDPNNPSVSLPVTATLPAPSVSVSPDVGFPPTVVQTVGACSSPKPLPISNTGICNVNIDSLTVGGTDASDYLFAGLPGLPSPLEPGHLLGEGNLDAVFAPLAIGRNRDATFTLAYESDPITHATASVTNNLCGEGVKTGARLLVTAGGVPVSVVKKIHLVRLTTGKTVDLVKNAPLQSFTPSIAACAPFQFHREWGTVSNPIQLVTGSYRLTVTIVLNGATVSKSVSFDVSTCTFNPNIVVAF
jgi:photosystem II stability/assembly factor-like uncharacterized protein